MMPPHTAAAPTRTGNTLVFEGYSLNYTDPAAELSVLDENGEPVPFEATLSTQREDRSAGAKEPPPGSIQVRCVLTVTFEVPQGDRPVQVSFLGDRWTL